MENIFLDANYFFDFVHRKTGELTHLAVDHRIFASVLSCHIFFYAFKVAVPSLVFNKQLERLNLVPFNGDLLKKALSGPTSDLEDNIQLHSAAEGECHYFLTRDKSLLKLVFFGKTRIAEALPV